MEKLKLLLTVFLITFSINTWSQTTQVSGTVLDELGMPLPGANVMVKGTKSGVTTDFDGNFTIAADNKKGVLQISYIGFTNKEVSLNGAKSYKIKLGSDATGLDEVAVIGYGSVKKSDLTGAVKSLNNKDLTSQKKTDIGQALQGRVSGVDVQTLSSKPGAPLSIKIRGNTVITNTTVDNDGVSDDVNRDLSKPLYVVDGIFFNNINILNPADIEQIDILKDVSATAIYGSRGANGVVIITTKNGIEGKTEFSYESTFGLRSATNLPDFFNGDEYLDFVDDALKAVVWRGKFTTSGGVGTVDDYNNAVIDRTTQIQTNNTEADNADSGKYTDWAKLIRKTGIQTSHNLSMSGGSNGLVYSGSLSYLKDEGVIGIEGYDRYNLSASLSKKVNDKLTVGVKSYLAFSTREEGSRELFRTSYRLAPTLSAYDTNGEIIPFPDAQDNFLPNPLYESEGTWFTNTKTIDVIASAFVNYKPAKWLSLKTQFAPNINTTRFGEFRGLLSKSSANNPASIRSYYNTDFHTSYTWDNIADLNFDIKEGHNLKATIISSIFYDHYEGSDTETRNYDTDAYSFYNTGAGTDIRNYDTYATKETLSSFAGRLNYSINNKYLFTFTGRYDGSSKLSAGNKWNFFPSAAFAWKASNEEFLKNINWLSTLKVRTSYGEAGNAQRVPVYSSFPLLSASNYLFNTTIGLGKDISTLANQELTWEVSKEYNFGLDFGFLNSRISGSFDYYNKKTVGSILSRQLSYITGFGTSTAVPSAIGNFGSVRNSGVEIALKTVNVKYRDFTWATNFNYTKNTNEILKLDGNLNTIPYGRNGVLNVGSSIDAVYGYEKLGIWQIDEAPAAAVYGAVPGLYKFKDQNNDNIINQADKVVLGSRDPKWVGGLTNSFSYKNLDMNVQVNIRQGVYGHSEFLQNFNAQSPTFNSLDLNYWTPNNPTGDYPIPGYGNQNSGASSADEWFFEDMSYVRVGNIGLGYKFNQDLLDKLSMNNMRISLDVQNPFTFTNYKGPDPETGLQNSYNMTYSVRTVLLGLSLSF
ncbi:SusC/RagA family TonB-linked outer membrane protein [Flavobacterium algicola]|uniref:SusC/RagA family TonB-linked outer membrane protein n=1 Tax=Flavobacterium algicola TaxID=556529 RepID=UPI001EFEBBC7|nr:TonB-dependent receptor [Flavobacterium algicola]MCG9793162.1 TonB-dependent receptor [Flavobacterium algicola]